MSDAPKSLGGSALKPIRTIVVGSSLGEASDQVVRAAADVGRAVGGRLEVVHSVPFNAVTPRFGSQWAEADFYSKWTEAQREELDSQVEGLKVNLPMRLRVESGSPYRTIIETAERTGADLIVVGASERGRFTRFLGGTADRILRGASCPVLVVRGDWRFPIERVLAPVDFSLLSADALECGLAFLGQVGEATAEVELFFAVSEFQRLLAEPLTPARLERFALQELKHFGRTHADLPLVQRSERVVVGAPAESILNEAGRIKADLVVLGTHGQGGVAQALLGSVAKSVATEAACPVLVIPLLTAIGASVADAVREQTQPHWRAPGASSDAIPGASRSGGGS